jgi:hypothetical protein
VPGWSGAEARANEVAEQIIGADGEKARTLGKSLENEQVALGERPTAILSRSRRPIETVCSFIRIRISRTHFQLLTQDPDHIQRATIYASLSDADCDDGMPVLPLSLAPPVIRHRHNARAVSTELRDSMRDLTELGAL